MIPLLWIDVETTGLDPRKHRLMEVALVATDDAVQIEDAISRVLYVPFAYRHNLDPVVEQMHKESGLLDCAYNPDSCQLDDAAQYLAGWIGERFKGRHVAGSSPWFDVGFIRAQIPAVAALLDRHCFDVTTLRSFFGLQKPAGSVHRALPDLMRDIETVRGLVT